MFWVSMRNVSEACISIAVLGFRSGYGTSHGCGGHFDGVYGGSIG